MAFVYADISFFNMFCIGQNFVIIAIALDFVKRSIGEKRKKKIMIQRYKILKDSRDGSFPGDEGGTIEWFWTKVLRVEDGVEIEIGGRQRFKAGEERDLDVIKTERRSGKGYNYRVVG